MLPDVAVRSGNNKQVALLPIAGFKDNDTVLVGQDKQAAAADPRGIVVRHAADARAAREPVRRSRVLRQQLKDMAGPGAVIRVDSFEGGGAADKSQIRSIRISRDQFAAEIPRRRRHQRSRSSRSRAWGRCA